MMTFSFDLISDLHLESWGDVIPTYMATSPVCVVAGDIGYDRTLIKEFFNSLTNSYQAVFYIDGNDEHRLFSIEDLPKSHNELQSIIDGIDKFVYLHDNVVVINGIAIVGTNGWWDYNFDPTIDFDQTTQWLCDYCKTNGTEMTQDWAKKYVSLALQDIKYLCLSVERLQKHPDIKKILMVTHTVPNKNLIGHDLSLAGTYRFNIVGNSMMDQVFEYDYERKISTWVFGHYHGDIDTAIDNVRYVNNPRGRKDSTWGKAVYYPKRITIDY